MKKIIFLLMLYVLSELGFCQTAQTDYNKGKEELEYKDYSRAIDYFSSAIALNPNDTNSYFYRGYAYFAQRNYELSIIDFTKTIKLDSTNSDAYFWRGILRCNMQKYHGAIADFAKAIEKKPDYIQAYGELGLLYFHVDKLDSAIIVTLTGLKYDPINKYLNDNVAWFYYENGENECAIMHFKICLQIHEYDFDALFGLAMIYFEEGELVIAKNYFNKAKNMEPLLKKRMRGIKELENNGYFFSKKNKQLLKKMFLRLK